MDFFERKCRVLVVDDDRDTRVLLVRLSRSYEVTAAESYDAALAAAERVTPDIVVTDISLGGRDGLELMRELRKRYDVPGIAVTGHWIEPEAYRQAGFVEWLRKPINFDDLLHALSETCRTSHQSAA